jgi:Lrp/AsnC family leucine-responsive transcriptional regulator
MGTRTFQVERMDAIDEKIAAALQADGRLSMRSLAKVVHVSAPAVGERVRRLEERGVIAGYGARIDRSAIRPQIVSFVELTMTTAAHDRLERFVAATDAVRDVHRIAGAGCYLLRLETPDHATLEQVVRGVLGFANYRLSVVVSSTHREPAATAGGL